MQTYNTPGSMTPQQLGFQPLGAAASGAPPPLLMPGQNMYQQQPYNYGSAFPQQQYAQQPYPQQFPQQYPGQLPMQQQYGVTQYPQTPYGAPMYGQAMPNTIYNQAMPNTMYNQTPPPYGYAQPGAIGYQGQQQQSSSQGFNMSSGLMGLAAGAVGGAALDHMLTGKHNHHNNSGHGGGYGDGMMPYGAGGNHHGGHHGHHH